MTALKSDAPPLTVWLVEDYAPFRNTVSRLLNGTDGMACTHIFRHSGADPLSPRSPSRQ